MTPHVWPVWQLLISTAFQWADPRWVAPSQHDTRQGTLVLPVLHGPLPEVLPVLQQLVELLLQHLVLGWVLDEIVLDLPIHPLQCVSPSNPTPKRLRFRLRCHLATAVHQKLTVHSLQLTIYCQIGDSTPCTRQTLGNSLRNQQCCQNIPFFKLSLETVTIQNYQKSIKKCNLEASEFRFAWGWIVEKQTAPISPKIKFVWTGISVWEWMGVRLTETRIKIFDHFNLIHLCYNQNAIEKDSKDQWEMFHVFNCCNTFLGGVISVSLFLGIP